MERVRALLMLSPGTFGMMWGGLLLILVSGIIGGFMQNWWAQGWIWASLVIFILIIVVMSVYVTPYYGALRKAAGAPYMEKRKIQEPQTPVSDAELAKLLESPRGIHAAFIGWAGLLVIVALMMFKPF